MNLQQLRYITAVAREGLNISMAAERLFTSQPGVSRQIRQLEDELGVQIFERRGKQLVRVTAAGEAVLALAQRALVDLEQIRRTAQEFRAPDKGTLSIATTHTQARYALPRVVSRFVRRYPAVTLHLHQGTPMQIAELAADGAVDFAIATEAMEHFENLVMLPCYHWNRAIITPCDHPLREVQPLTLEAVAEYPILTYVFGFTGRSQLDTAFRQRGLQPHVVFTATDADVIKTYVRLGLGVGIVARMAYAPDIDTDLCALDASHLFEPSTTRIGLRRGITLRGYMYDFIAEFAPHLTRARVDAAMATTSHTACDALFTPLSLPSL
ncbi:HTH-type transcriptional regulator CysB [Sulfurivermis fontis]|jgi:LysR family cys regulon transcriptional activator|uniref:HTH-type transcriptional regulator CysB n=1 Tax=Sulfurivermis fontis TaxID=1972068 RepID=UPI000FDCB144|nr:HTH-type transcriptional regulator CysB [Sulfurivermis fontis]